jgi:hypothetical protein
VRWTFDTPEGDSVTITLDEPAGKLSFVTTMDDQGRMTSWSETLTIDSFLRWGPPAVRAPVEVPAPEAVLREIVARLGAPVPRWLSPLPDASLRLLRAAIAGADAGVEAALRAGAPVDAADAFGNCALVHAIKAGQPRVAVALLRAGARATAVYEFRGESATALELAKARGQPEVMAELIAHGAGAPDGATAIALEIRTARSYWVRMAIVGVLLMPMPVVALRLVMESHLHRPLSLLVVGALPLVAVVMLWRERRRWVRRFDADGAVLRNGRRLRWSVFQGVRAIRSSRGVFSHYEVVFLDGVGKIFPAVIEDREAVLSLLSALERGAKPSAGARHDRE